MLEVHPKTGFIKQYRSILNNPICCKDADTFAVWNYLLLKATHKPYYVLFKGAKVLLQPGQLITGRKKIARFWHISESKVQRILKMLKSEQQIEQQTSNVSRLITVSNWDKYQVSEQQSEQPVNNQRTLYKNTKNIKNNNNTKTIIKNKSFKTYTEKEFIDEVKSFKVFEEYHQDFIDYWIEPSPSGKMKFQLQKTWSTKLRLGKWSRSSFNKPTVKQKSTFSQVMIPGGGYTND